MPKTLVRVLLSFSGGSGYGRLTMPKQKIKPPIAPQEVSITFQWLIVMSSWGWSMLARLPNRRPPAMPSPKPT